MATTGSEPVHFFAVVGMGLRGRQRHVSHSFAARFAFPAIEHWREDFAGARKLRIGYLSADFRRHATALLMAELFERHDKSCFEIVAYSHGPVDRGELSARLRAAFDDLVDIRAMTDVEAARRITADRIDILVELKGYTKGARTGIAAQRPAPVQESFVPLASYGLPLPASRLQSRPPHPGQGKPRRRNRLGRAPEINLIARQFGNSQPRASASI